MRSFSNDVYKERCGELGAPLQAWNHLSATRGHSAVIDLRVGVQNVFDKKSPIVGDTVGTDINAGSTFPNTYDVIGRTFFAGVSLKF